MIPNAIVMIKALERTAIGKIARTHSKTTASNLEIHLGRIWKELLRLSEPPQGNSDFFALGGDSGAMVTIGGIKGLSLLLTSKVGRRLLTQANSAKNKKGMAGLSPQINAEIARITKAMVDTGKERAVPVIALPESDDR